MVPDILPLKARSKCSQAQLWQTKTKKNLEKAPLTKQSKKKNHNTKYSDSEKQCPIIGDAFTLMSFAQPPLCDYTKTSDLVGGGGGGDGGDGWDGWDGWDGGFGVVFGDS